MGMLIDVEIPPAGWGAPPPVWLDDDWADPIAHLIDAPDASGGPLVARPVDPIDRVVDHLATVDRAMASVLRQLAQAGPRNGLPVRRQVALLAGATGTDVGFLDRAVEVLRAMPRTQTSFDDGMLSWSQIRGIVGEARSLSVAQRAVLDDALAGTVAQGRLRGEPDRVVEICGDLAARIDRVGQERVEAAQERGERLVMQLGVDGWAEVHGTLSPVTAATVGEALDTAADVPVAPDAPPATDDDGKTLPVIARPPTSRAAQWAVALERICATYLSGTGTGRARPRAYVIAPLADLLPDAAPTARPPGRTNDDARVDDLVGSVTARLLLRRGNGRRRITRALLRSLADDAELIPVFTDDGDIPVAIGDRYSPITPAMRRAVTARDQACRAPGCSAPSAHCDVHHVIPREDGGPAEVANLMLACRFDHTRLTRHRWQLTLHPDATLTVRIGRHAYTTRPRLPAPPTVTDGRQPGRPDQPVTP